jgi:DNA-binding CsgD family transcriptional regulator
MRLDDTHVFGRAMSINQEAKVPIVLSGSGFLLLDSSLNPIASNSEAVQILSFPSKPDRIKQLNTFLSDRVRTALVDHHSQDTLGFVREYKSGRRRYTCRSFQIDGDTRSSPPRPSIAVLLERASTGDLMLEEISKQFDLTHRERETVELLLQGLTSKEIANRMGISPNTVKAFLRLVMVKMGVSTRSGIVGRFVASNAGG